MRKLPGIVLCFVISISFILLTACDNDTSGQKLEITMFNVGAGDSFYIEMPNGDDILIDGGLESYGQQIVSKLLEKEKNMSLEYVISTHPDADHAGGLQTVFKKLQVKNFYYNTCGRENPRF